MSYDSYRTITIVKPDSTFPDLERRVWKLDVYFHRVVLRVYSVEKRKTKRHKWTTETWSMYEARRSVLKEPELPDWVVEQALVEFVETFIAEPKEVYRSPPSSWNKQEPLATVRYPRKGILP